MARVGRFWERALSTRVGLRLAVGLTSVTAQAQIKLPHLDLISEPKLSGCLKNDAATAGTDDVKWQSLCPLDKLLMEAAKIEHPSPPIRLLIGQLIYSEILRLHADILVGPNSAAAADSTPMPPPTPLSAPAALPNSPRADLLNSVAPARALGKPVAAAVDTPEGKLLAQTEALIEAAKKWLSPLFRDSPVAIDATLLYFGLLGDSLRFQSAQEFLGTSPAFLRARWARAEMLRTVSHWVDAYGATALRPWLRNRLEEMRTAEIHGAKSDEFFYWTKSLALTGRPADIKARRFMSAKLRELLVAYPGDEEQTLLKKLVEFLGLTRNVQIPSQKTMSGAELLVRAQALVRGVQTDEALRTIKELVKLPREQLTNDEIWAAFQLHVKILRILDERAQIAKIIPAYLKIEAFDRPRIKSPDVPRALERAFDTAKLYWTYGDSADALTVVERLVKVARAYKFENWIAQGLYLKARVLEQGPDKAQAMVALDQALNSRLSNDLAYDILWRRVFLSFDVAAKNQNFVPLLSLFESMKKSAIDTDRPRWHYWYGEALRLNQKKEESLSQFRLAYDAEPLSYYSNLAALQLKGSGESPKRWLLAKAEKFDTPDWPHFFNADGGSKVAAYGDLAHALFLSQIGQRAAAERAFLDVDRDVWTRVLSSSIAAAERQAFARAVGWLHLATGDNVGSMRALEVARQAFGSELNPVDWLYLYPLPFWNLLQANAQVRKLNPWLVASLIRQESGFNSLARSPANAMGLMQMIPPVATFEAKLLGKKVFVPTQLYDPGTAVELGAHHLEGLLDNFDGSWICSLASYNAGSPPVRKWLSFYPAYFPAAFIERIPYTETRNYVKSILRNFVNYQRIYAKGEIDIAALARLPAAAVSTAETDKSNSAF